MESRAEDKCLEFGALMRDVIDEQVKTTNKLEVDLSFMNTIVTGNESKKRKNALFSRRILKIAAIVICFFTITTITSTWMISQEAYALKYNLQRKLYMLKDGFTASNDNVETDFSDESNFSVTISDIKDLDKALKLMPDLPVPEYIPDGFALATLTVTKWFDGAYNVEYVYNAGEKELNIVAYKAAGTESPSISINGTKEVLEMEDRTIAVWHDIFNDIVGCTVLMDDILIDISGEIAKEELIEISKAIK